MANFQLEDVQKVSYALAALDADGNAATLDAGDTIAVTSGDSTMASVVPDATPAAGFLASGFILGGAVEGTVLISAAVTKADGSAGASGGVAIDVTSGPAASITFSLGAPVAQ